MNVIEVIWDDAFSSSSDMTIEKAHKNTPLRTHTIGYLLSENDAGITVCTDIYPKEPETGAHCSFIPHGMIVECWEYK